jgi:hypothetical protein
MGLYAKGREGRKSNMRNGLLFPNPTNDKATTKQTFLLIVTDYKTFHSMRRV